MEPIQPRAGKLYETIGGHRVFVPLIRTPPPFFYPPPGFKDLEEEETNYNDSDFA